MKTWMLETSFGVDALRIVEREPQRPGPHEVLIRVHAIALNYRDWVFVDGRVMPDHPLPLVPGADCAGVVAAVGPGTSRVRVGDRVAATFNRWQAGRPQHRELVDATPGGIYDLSLGVRPRDGVLAETAVFDEARVVHVPPHLSFEEAATLPVAGVTAWHALFGDNPLRVGETVVVQGTGGVATFAIQLAAAAGARVIVTSSSDAKLAKAKLIGADDGINYRTNPAWDDAVLDLTHGVGADVVVDVTGGQLGRSIHALRTGGRVVVIGFLSGFASQVDIFPLLLKNARIQGIFVGSREMFEGLAAAVTKHRLRPVIDRVYAFEDAPAAIAALADGDYVGKLVVRGANLPAA